MNTTAWPLIARLHCTPHTPAHLAGALRRQLSFSLILLHLNFVLVTLRAAIEVTAALHSAESVLGLFLKQAACSMSQPRAYILFLAL